MHIFKFVFCESIQKSQTIGAIGINCILQLRLGVDRTVLSKINLKTKAIAKKSFIFIYLFQLSAGDLLCKSLTLASLRSACQPIKAKGLKTKRI
ncbi:MAG: hypothetical protein ACYDDE_07005 [bacterium]